MNLFEMATVEKASQGFDVEIKNPITGEKTGAVIRVYGEDAPEYKAMVDEFTRECRDAKITLSNDEAKLKLTILSVISWRGVEDDNGEMECTAENCERLFKQVPIVLNQVSNAAFDRKNFMRG